MLQLLFPLQLIRMVGEKSDNTLFEVQGRRKLGLYRIALYVLKLTTSTDARFYHSPKRSIYRPATRIRCVPT
jgi:hypothetical protein